MMISLPLGEQWLSKPDCRPSPSIRPSHLKVFPFITLHRRICIVWPRV